MKQTSEAKICVAALRLAAKRDWHSLTLEQIAAAAKIPLAQAKKIVASKDHLLPSIVRYMDAQAIAKTGKVNPRTAPHDRLFEIMMARFDALQEHRAGILSIFKDIRRDPSLARLIIPAQMQAMQKMLTLARLDQDGLPQPLVAFGLLAIYYRTLWRWQKDNSKDMAPTMAALDQALRCAARFTDILTKKSKIF